MDNQKIGIYAFLLGIIIAVIVGLLATYAATSLGATTLGVTTAIVVVLGLIVGFLNISEKQITPFLIAVIALAVSGVVAGTASLTYLNFIPTLGTLVANVVGNITMFVVPAGIVVAIKAIWDMASQP
jgi:hypothetical protein